ncbi:MAG: lipocalin family protein [Spirochaetota bacterium]
MFLLACSSVPTVKTVENVDIQRFMGKWYVIANIPTFVERGAHNAIESYKLNEDGSIDTTFTFNKDSFDGPVKQYNPKGFIINTKTNAEWGMQFVWPIKAEYLIIYLDDDYTTTVIGRSKKDYVWIMARTPVISDSQYNAILNFLKDIGYDISKIKRVPHKWNE